MKLNDRVVVLADDPANNLIGTLVGTANYVLTANDASVLGSDAGEMRSAYVVLLDLEHQGNLGEDDNYISHIIVHPDGLELAPWYVSAYEVDYAHGGPEEGGWGYYTYDRVHGPVQFSTEHEARRYADTLTEAYPENGDRPLSSVLYSGGAYNIRVTNAPGGAHYPTETPHYE